MLLHNGVAIGLHGVVFQCQLACAVWIDDGGRAGFILSVEAIDALFQRVDQLRVDIRRDRSHVLRDVAGEELGEAQRGVEQILEIADNNGADAFRQEVVPPALQ